MIASPALDSVLQAIGRTPLVRLHRLVPPDSADVVVKLEYFQSDWLVQGSDGARND